MGAAGDFTQFLAASRAVRFGDFTLKSGKKSNIFINFGDLSTGAELAAMGHFFAKKIVDDKLGKVDAIFGPAYKGINIAIATAIALANEFGIDLPVTYNRKEKKAHGEGGLFVGHDLSAARSVLVVDDVITDGMAKYETIEMLKAYPKLEIAAMLIGVDREDADEQGNPYRAKFEAATGILVHAITTKSALLKLKGMS